MRKCYYLYPESDYSEQSPGRPGGVLHASASYLPNSLDIQTQGGGNLLWEGRWVYDNLVYLDTRGEATPWLAKSWEISADGRVYIFHLRHDVTFSDGTRFNAEAVKVNFDRIKALGAESRIASAYIAPYVSGVVVDEFTFAAHLDQPYYPFLSYLAQSWLGIISPRQIQEDPESITNRPIGTGPFVVAEYQPKVRAVFKRRPDYSWSPDHLHHSGPAYLDSIILDAVADDKVRAADLESGRHHFSLELPFASVPDVKANTNLVYSNRLRAGSPMRSLAFNTHRFPFQDVLIRRAVALAINREAITKLIGGEALIPKTDFLVSTTPGYDPEFKDVLAYDPGKADALLDQDGWQQRDTDGIRLKNHQRLSAELVTTGGERTPPASVLAMQENLKAVGLELKINNVSGDKISTLVQTGQYDALTGGWWSSVTPDVLYLLYHSSQIARQHTLGQDTANLADPTLDGLLQKARQTSDPTERGKTYREVQRLLTELVPVVPLHESQHVIAYTRRLHGLLFDTSHNTPILTAAWLEK